MNFVSAPGAWGAAPASAAGKPAGALVTVPGFCQFTDLRESEGFCALSKLQ
jgi:hypothetical protein